jgi:hypothetical protein
MTMPRPADDSRGCVIRLNRDGCCSCSPSRDRTSRSACGSSATTAGTADENITAAADPSTNRRELGYAPGRAEAGSRSPSDTPGVSICSAAQIPGPPSPGPRSYPSVIPRPGLSPCLRRPSDPLITTRATRKRPMTTPMTMIPVHIGPPSVRLPGYRTRCGGMLDSRVGRPAAPIRDIHDTVRRRRDAASCPARVADRTNQRSRRRNLQHV